MSYLGITQQLRIIADAYANIDANYGPYENIAEALSNIPESLRKQGLTVGILDNNEIKEYWWKNGIDNNELVPKTSDSADLDIEVSAIVSNPGNPTTHPGNWYDPSLLTGNERWMAFRIAKNDVWGNWIVFPIVGEGGPPGSEGSHTEIRFALNSSFSTPPIINTTERYPNEWTLNTPTPVVGQYVWLTTAVIDANNLLEQNWTYPVRLTGEKGDKGEPGEGETGLPGLTISVTNGTHVFAGNSTNAFPAATQMGIQVIQDTTAQVIEVQEITNHSIGMTTQIVDNNTDAPSIEITVTSALTDDAGILYIPLLVNGATYVTTFSWSVSRTGGLIWLDKSSDVFHIDKAGVITPATITVTAQSSDTVIDKYEYRVDGGPLSETLPTGVTRSSNVITIQGNQMSASSYTFKVSDASGISDSGSIHRNADGSDGEDGGSAELLYLSASTQIVTFTSTNSADPSTQNITLTANLQNVLGTVVWTATKYNGTTDVGNAILTGTGNTRTLAVSQFAGSVTSVRVTVTLGSLTDTITVVKIGHGAPGSGGVDSIVGYLTNENITFPANSSGTVTSYEAGTGTFNVFEGLTNVNSTADYSKVSETGAVGAITSAGVYSVTSMSADQASIVFRAVYKGVTIDKILTLSKSKAGDPGLNGYNQATVYLYRRTETESPPDKPTNVITYTFSSGDTTAANNDWTRSLTSSGGRFRWVIQAQVISRLASDTIAASKWSEPVIISEDGVPGTIGPAMAYRGQWNSKVKYEGKPNLVEFVTTGLAGSREGWITRSDASAMNDGAGIPVGTSPTDTTYFNGPIASADAIFTDFLIAYSAYIDNLTVGIIQTSTEKERTTIGYTPAESTDPTKDFSRHAPRGYYESGRIGWTITYVPDHMPIAVGEDVISDAYALIFYKDEAGSPVHGAFSSNLDRVVFTASQVSYYPFKSLYTNITNSSMSLIDAQNFINFNEWIYTFIGFYKRVYLNDDTTTTIYAKTQTGHPTKYVTGTIAASPNVADGWYLTDISTEPTFTNPPGNNEIWYVDFIFTRYVEGVFSGNFQVAMSIWSANTDTEFIEYTINASEVFYSDRNSFPNIQIKAIPKTQPAPVTTSWYVMGGNRS